MSTQASSARLGGNRRPGRRGLGRSIRLFQGFRHEGTDPTSFYRLLADDTVAEVSGYCQLEGARILDVGGASGYVAEAFADVGARAVTAEYDRDQMIEHGRRLRLGIVADGCNLPVGDEAFDVAYSSNVLEHVVDPARMLSEMVRVVSPGGIVFVTFTNWFSPWGGHETAPWHYLGGAWAAQRYQRRHGAPPKNRFGVSLFPLHVAGVLAWCRSCDQVDVLDAFPRYYPSWTTPLVAVPGLREFATWNLAVVMRRRAPVVRPAVSSLNGVRHARPSSASAVARALGGS